VHLRSAPIIRRSSSTRALRFADGAPAELRAELLERQSYECHVTEDFAEAIAMQQHACALRGELGDRLREGAALRWLSRVLWFAGRVDEADQVGREAVTLLEQLDPGRELALAYANLAHIALNLEAAPAVEEWGNRALALGERLEDTEVVAAALNSIGTMELLSGNDSGRTKLERSRSSPTVPRWSTTSPARTRTSPGRRCGGVTTTRSIARWRRGSRTAANAISS
jgi:tetratricopeptide repeat protein